MTIQAMERLTGGMVVSDTFRAGMLTGNRAELLKGFDLDPEELAGVMAIQAATPEEFYAAITLLIQKRERGETLLPPLSA